nr:silk gland uncharacterized conserved 2 [Tineola bisselliella]
MKWLLVFGFLGWSLASELPLAEQCNPAQCQLPNCRCSSSSIPDGLAARDTPQFVMVTFDDGVNIRNIETYRRVLYGRVNSKGCRAGVTFYVNHQFTSYALVNELYNQGYELSLHSISHQTPQTYWADADFETLVKEIADQRPQMAHFANIPEEAIKGVRIPFLQLSGNNSFAAMKEAGLLYDCTWGTVNQIDPGLWPYTLDFRSTQECLTPPCPTASIPGIWVLPMISWIDDSNSPCVMVDACFSPPDQDDEDAWFRFIVRNFERHYLGNRAPFGFFIHEWYLTVYPKVERALERFMDMINNMHDVFMVNSHEVIDWVKNPVPINEYRQQQCNTVVPRPCSSENCGPLKSDHDNQEYWMAICGDTCPRVYPWLGNPLGE